MASVHQKHPPPKVANSIFSIITFSSFFIDGYASVSAIIAGKLKGEHNFKDLKLLVKIITKYALVVSGLLGVLFLFLYSYVGQVFTNDVLVIETFETFFWMVLIMQPLNAIAFVYDDVYKGMAEATVLRNTQLIATFLGFIPTLLLFDYFGFKIFAIWIAFLVWMFLRALLLRLKFVKLLKLNFC